MSPTSPDRKLSDSGSQDVWVRTIIGWHAAFWLMLAVVALVLLIQPDVTATTTSVALALLAVLGAAYAVLGAPAARSRSVPRSRAYLAVLVSVVAGLVALDANVSFLLFLAYPQVWFFSNRPRDGVAGTVLLTAAVGVAFVVAVGTSADAVSAFALSMGVSLVFSLLMGLWIGGVITQSRRRADLIRELETTRAELAEAHHAQGVMAERERLAREIHDTLAQGFTSVVMLAQAAQAQLPRDPDAVPAQLSAIERTARENLAEARAVVAAFSPVALDGTDLAGALRRLADRFSRETGVDIDVAIAPEVEQHRLARDREVVLLRAAQEALANVRRHAGARRVTVRLWLDGGAAQVEVSDDGSGFDQDAALGFGLSGMRDRVEDVGGDMDVVTGPGRGTQVRVRVPAVPAVPAQST
ncbi:MAG: sensor histidine kinase [Actinomycetes bacterium]